VIGTARLTPTRLVVTTNSLERAEVLAQSLRAELTTLATWKKREREELPAMLGGETVMMDAQSMRSASVVDAFRGWLDSASPLLAGRTPRNAVADEAGRSIVHVMLKDLEHRHASSWRAGLRRKSSAGMTGSLLASANCSAVTFASLATGISGRTVAAFTSRWRPECPLQFRQS